jgi:aspartate 1-decarboxylase
MRRQCHILIVEVAGVFAAAFNTKDNKAMRWMLRSKIHNATVTDANLKYEGSITIDQELIERVGLLPGEKVLVVSNTSGARLETYVIAGARDSGVICINGAAAHLVKKGEEVIIMGFELTDSPIRASAVLVDGENRFVRAM